MAQGRLLFHHRPYQPRTVAVAAAEGRAWNSQSGVFLCFLLLPGHFFPSLRGPRALPVWPPVRLSVVVTPQLCPPSVIGGPQSSVAPRVPRERAWGCGLTARLPVAGSLCCGSAEAYGLSLVSARTHFHCQLLLVFQSVLPAPGTGKDRAA